MKRPLFLLSLIVVSLLALCQSKPDRMFLDELPKTSIQTNAVVRYSSTTYKVTEENKMKATYEYVITILDDEGESLSYVVLPYDQFSKITSGKIWIYNQDGEILEKVRLSEMTDNAYSGSNLYSDSRIKYYITQVKSTPYTVHCIYEKIYNGFFHLPSWYPQMRNDVYVEKAILNIISSEKHGFNHFEYNLNDSLFTYEKKENLMTWEASNIPSFVKPLYSSDLSDLLPQIELPMNYFKMEGFEGSLTSWKSFGNWIFRMNNVLDRLSSETRSYLKAMTDSISDPKAKAEIIYKWMQKETRYVSIQLGIGGWQPFSPAFVDENKYGDCKALTYYTRSLLSAVGIQSYYTLIQAGDKDKAIEPDKVFDQFNHVILCVPFDGDTTWLECTSNDAPFGYLGDFTDDRYGLLIQEHSSKLVKTIKYTSDKNLLKRKSIIQVNEEGGFKGILEAEYHNIQSEKRWFQKDENLRDQMDHIYEMVDVKGFYINELKYDFVDQKNPIVQEFIDFDAHQVARMTSSKMLLPLYYLNKKTRKLKNDEKRQFDIVLKRGSSTVDTIIYKIPKSFTAGELPDPIVIESDFGKYEASTWIENNQIYYARKEIVNDGRFPPERWEDFINYKNAVRKANKATAILEKTK